MPPTSVATTEDKPPELRVKLPSELVGKKEDEPKLPDGGLPGDQMSKIYQEELAKIMQQQQKNLGGGGPGSGLFPSLGGLFGRGPAEAGSGGPPPPLPPANELQRAMDIYQQELSRLQQNALAAAFRSAQNGGKDVEAKEGGKTDGPDREQSHENGSENKPPPTSLSSQSSPSSGKNFP